jgi:outer membrane protein assembly factor BamA
MLRRNVISPDVMFSFAFLLGRRANGGCPSIVRRLRSFRNRRVLARRCLALCLSLGMLMPPGFSQDTTQQPPARKPPQPQPKPPASTPPQEKQVLPTYEGQNVSRVELAGRPDLKTDELQSMLPLKAGQPFSRAKIDESVAVLKSTNQFQDVQLRVVPDINGVRVMLILQPGLYFGMYEFPGAVGRGFSYSRLLQVSNYPPEGPYTQADVTNATATLVHFFERNGYFEAKVEPRLTTYPKDQLVNVTFETTLGRRAKFGNVDLEGASPEQTKHLHRVLRSLMARLRGSAIRPGKRYSLKTLQNATQYMTNALMKQDHLDAEVKLIGAEYDQATNRADVKFHIEEGPVIHVKVQGAHLWSWTRRRLLPVYAQVGVDPEIIQEGRRNLISNFQSKGYFNVQVKADVQKQQNGQTIVYSITKGPRHKVADVGIAGNQSIDEGDLLKHVAVQKARFLSHGKYSERLVTRSRRNLEAVYKSEGFSSVRVTPQVKNDNGNIAVTFHVDEGPRDIVEALNINGNETLSLSQIAPKGLKVTEGQPYSQKLVDQDRTQIQAQYLRLGYPTATFRASAKPIDKDPHRLAVTYQIYEGPRVTTANIVTLGRRATRQSFIDRTADLQSGEAMNSQALLTSESKLYQPGIFDWAEVNPRRQITTQDREDVVVKVHEAKRNTLVYGFGFEVINRGGSVPGGTVAVPGLPVTNLPSNFKTSEKTFWGPRGTLEYTRRNIRGKAESMTFSGLAGRLVQRASVNYQDPHFRSSDWISNLTLQGEHNSENPIFTSRDFSFGPQLQRPLDDQGQKNLFLRYSYKQTGLTRLLIPDLVPAQDQHVRLSTFSGSYIRDTRDNVLDAHKGIYESFEVGITPEVLGASVSFSRLTAQTAYYKKLKGNTIWANSIRLGFEKPFSGSHVPLSEAFFSGGGSTLRGFPLNGAGPQRTISACGTPGDVSTCAPITVPVGGNQLFIVNSEFRIPVPLDLPLLGNKLGIATFYDGGNVFRSIGFHGQYTNTFGGGLRYSTPVGPVRIDIGHNLNAPPGIKSTQIFITLGQAF